MIFCYGVGRGGLGSSIGTYLPNPASAQLTLMMCHPFKQHLICLFEYSYSRETVGSLLRMCLAWKKEDRRLGIVLHSRRWCHMISVEHFAPNLELG